MSPVLVDDSYPPYHRGSPPLNTFDKGVARSMQSYKCISALCTSTIGDSFSVPAISSLPGNCT